MEEVIEERTKSLNHEEGETISWDDYQDIYCQVKGEERVKYNFELNTRNKQGEIADYLEVRRPFGAPEKWEIKDDIYMHWVYVKETTQTFISLQ